MKIVFTTLCLSLLALTPAFAADEANSGFGAPFAAIEPAAFADPVTEADAAAAAAAVEPASGVEEVAEETAAQPNLEPEPDYPVSHEPLAPVPGENTGP